MKCSNWFVLVCLLVAQSFLVPLPCSYAAEPPPSPAPSTEPSVEDSPVAPNRGSVIPQENEEEIQGVFKDVSIDLSFLVWSKYLSSSGGIVFHDEPVIQSALNISFDKVGIYLNLWNSTGLNGGGFSSDFGDEFDITVGWIHTFEESGISIDVGISRFDVLPVGKISDSDVTQPFITISREWEIADKHTIEPYVRFEVLWADGEAPKGETYIHLGTNYNIEITEELSLGQKFDVCYDPGMFGFDAGFIGEYGIGLGLDIDSVHIDLLQVRVSTPLESLNDDRGTEVALGVGFSVRF